MDGAAFRPKDIVALSGRDKPTKSKYPFLQCASGYRDRTTRPYRWTNKFQFILDEFIVRSSACPKRKTCGRKKPYITSTSAHPIPGAFPSRRYESQRLYQWIPLRQFAVARLKRSKHGVPLEGETIQYFIAISFSFLPIDFSRSTILSERKSSYKPMFLCTKTSSLKPTVLLSGRR